MALRRMLPATALATAGLILACGCGGTLEGKYRRGQITTSTTAGQRAPATTPTSAPTTSSTVPTGGNAAGQSSQGEPGRVEPGGSIVRSAARRAVVSPLGGRHR